MIAADLVVEVEASFWQASLLSSTGSGWYTNYHRKGIARCQPNVFQSSTSCSAPEWWNHALGITSFLVDCLHSGFPLQYELASES
jgi:hypothetical protein